MSSNIAGYRLVRVMYDNPPPGMTPYEVYNLQFLLRILELAPQRHEWRLLPVFVGDLPGAVDRSKLPLHKAGDYLHAMQQAAGKRVAQVRALAEELEQHSRQAAQDALAEVLYAAELDNVTALVNSDPATQIAALLDVNNDDIDIVRAAVLRQLSS
jgi:hypothetical protein